MWFKMSSELLHHPSLWCAARTRGSGDCRSDARRYAIVRLLCASADGVVFADAAQMRVSLWLGERTAQIVWEELISAGVLRDTGSGWSARDWMAEHGLFGEPRTSSRPRARKIAEPPAEPERPRKKEGWQAWFDDNGRFIGHD